MQNKTHREIIIDTNFWLLPFERRINIVKYLDALSLDSPYIMLVPTPVYNEVKMFAGQSTAKAKTRAAKSALLLINKYISEEKAQLEQIDDRKPDGAIISIALRKKCWVATVDKGLAERLKAHKIRVIILKDGNVLDFL